jgi:hypothetical protein
MLRATNLCIYLFVCFCTINCNKNHPGQCKTFERIYRQKSRVYTSSFLWSRGISTRSHDSGYSAKRMKILGSLSTVKIDGEYFLGM